MQNNLRFLKDVLYRLKHSFGQKIRLHNQINNGIDYTTGKKTTTLQEYDINRAIVLPTNLDRNFYYTMVSANFKYGGEIVEGATQIVIDAKDLPSGIEISVDNWYVTIDGLRYQLKQIEKYNSGIAWYLQCTAVENAQLDRIIRIHVESWVNNSQEATT